MYKYIPQAGDTTEDELRGKIQELEDKLEYHENIFYSLKAILKFAHRELAKKYSKRKRLSQDEVWERATITNDIKQVNDWIDELTKTN